MNYATWYQPSYCHEASVFQCIRVGENEGGNPDLRALVFKPGDEQPFSIESLQSGPVVALPDVHVRIDPPSITATNYTDNLYAGMFMVSGEEAFVAVANGFRNWALINISNGRPVVGNRLQDWISFSRWMLVVEDESEEIRIASFGVEEAD